MIEELMIKTFALLAQKSAQISIYRDNHNCNTVFDGIVNIGSHCKKLASSILCHLVKFIFLFWQWLSYYSVVDTRRD